MSRRPILVVACALAAASFGSVPAWVLLRSMPASAATASNSTSESSSPIADQGANFNYRSEITSLAPDVKGLSIEVLEFADRLVLTNHTRRAGHAHGHPGRAAP